MTKFQINIISAIFVLIVSNGNAQSIDPKSSFHVNVGLPINISNESFKGIMQGLFNASTHYQHTLKNTLCLGIGINYSLFTLNEFKVSEKIKGSQQLTSLFVKVGREKFHSSTFGTDYGLKVGYTYSFFNSDSLSSQGRSYESKQCLYFEPQFGLMLTMDESTTIKLNIGYVIQYLGFRPSYMGLASNNGYDPNNFNKITQYFTIGFGYTHYFKSKK